MLGFFSRAAAETNVKLALDGMKKALQIGPLPLPSSIWLDKHVFGWTSGAIGTLLMYENSGPTKLGYRFLQEARSWQHLTGLPKKLYERDVPIYLQTNDTNFSRGYDAGILWACLATRTAKTDHAKVAAAIAEAEKLPNFKLMSDPLTAAAEWVFMRDLWQPIQELRA